MDVKLPNLGEGADSGTVVNLFVKEGDQIAKDQPILELENEKAVAPRFLSKPAIKSASAQNS
jgi:pyruvate/2-oxoglutarate dehydrogenase complex dihydrolipoamide acyltransferase (E2) component